MPEPATVFEDPLVTGDWCVEWEDDDGGVELTMFAGPDARDRAFQYAGLSHEPNPQANPRTQLMAGPVAFETGHSGLGFLEKQR